MDLGTIGAIGFVLSLISIPFISDSVTMSAVSDYKLPVSGILEENMSDFDTQDSKKYPGSVEKSIGPDEFEYKTETAFGSFFLQIKNKNDVLQVTETLENSKAKIQRIILSNETMTEKWIFENNNGVLESIQTPTMIKEKISTSSGTCFKEKNMGNNKEYCNGQIHQIDNLWEDQKEEMQEYAERLKNVSTQIELLNVESTQWES